MAKKVDEKGAKTSRDYSAAAQPSVPMMMQNVIDRCMKTHGAGGLSNDDCLAAASDYASWCRQADGSDQVHAMSLGRQITERYS